MTTITIKEFQTNLDTYFDLIESNKEPIAIQRGENKNTIVLVPLSEYNSMKETEYLLSTEANRKILEKSMKELEEGKNVKFKLED